MTKTLPIPANLEHLKNEAKTLLKSLKKKEPVALALAVDHLYRCCESSNPTEEHFRLSDACLIVAREYGCRSWEALKKKIAPGMIRFSFDFKNMPDEAHCEKHLWFEQPEFQEDLYRYFEEEIENLGLGYDTFYSIRYFFPPKSMNEAIDDVLGTCQFWPPGTIWYDYKVINLAEDYTGEYIEKIPGGIRLTIGADYGRAHTIEMFE